MEQFHLFDCEQSPRSSSQLGYALAAKSNLFQRSNRVLPDQRTGNRLRQAVIVGSYLEKAYPCQLELWDMSLD